MKAASVSKATVLTGWMFSVLLGVVTVLGGRRATDQPQVILLNDGTRLTFLGLTYGNFHLDLPRAREIKTLNLKLAFHKSRFVEFTVTPSRPSREG